MARSNSRPDDVVAEIHKLAGSGKKVVFVSGNFNTVHPGHLRLLRFAAECGDFLVVGVSDNSAAGALLPVEFRLDGIRAIGIVDFAFVLPRPPELIIRKLKPAIVVKGKEHETKFNPEQL